MQQSTRNRGKAIVTSSAPTYDPEPATVTEDEEISKEKEIDKLMALISLSFKKIYKPTNNNLRTSSNTSRANQDNSSRINRGTGYDNQRAVNVAGARENVEVTLDAADNFGPIFDTEPLQKVQNDDDNYNVFANDKEHPEQPESVNDTYLEEKGDTNITMDSLDMSTNRETVDQDDDALAKEREIEDFKTKNKSLESSNDHFKEANNELKKTNQLMFKDLKKFQAKLDRFHDVNYASKMEIDCGKAKGDLLVAHQETISIMSQEKEAQNKFYKTREDKEIEKVIALENKVKVLEDIVYKIGQSVQTMNMLNHNCKTSFVKHEFLKKAQSANPRLTKMPMVVPISTREPKRTVNQSVATALKRTVAAESTNQKPRSTIRKQYEHISMTCKWWYSKITPPGYKWKPKSRTVNVEPNLVEILLFIVNSGCSKHITGNLKLLSNFVEKFLGTMKFGNDQIAPILVYGDLVQGNVTIKRVYYVEGLNHNLFSVGQFRDADLEVAFQKSTCFIRDLKGNDLLIGSSSADLYSITLQDTSTPNPI
ncbi:hypothetical protein Tco_0741316 [Tanacetum coccineum]